MKADLGSEGSLSRVSGSSGKSLMTTVLASPHLWTISLIVAVLVLINYHELLKGPPILENLSSILGFGLTRHTLERILFLVPVTYAVAIFGLWGGLSTLLLASAAMFPRIFILSPAPRDALFETVGVLFTGLLIVFLFDSLQKGRHRLSQLETAQLMLNQQVERLGMLHVISSIASQSLQLKEVLAISGRVRQMMHADACWLCLVAGDGTTLALADSSGLEGSQAQCDLNVDHNMEAEVVHSRKPINMNGFSGDRQLKSGIIAQDDLKSVLVVPMISKSEVLGTLGIYNRANRPYGSDDTDLMHALADQISLAIDNARLYEKERSVAEALRSSEKNYRDLFDNASDAIWVRDLNGQILAVNSAFRRLTGYGETDLTGANVSEFFSRDDSERIDRLAHAILQEGRIAAPIEANLIRNDKTILSIQVGTSLIRHEGEPWAFQHIGRDITEEKRVQENLKSYVRQVSQAQEAERKRIARELHDDTAQALVAVIRNLEDKDAGHSQLTIGDIREQLRRILQGVRHFSQQLRPSVLDDLGLLPALNWLASDLTKNYGIVASVSVSGTPKELSSDAELTLFRITQEALTNVRKHSNAKKADVSLEFSDYRTRLRVQDDGKGFDLPERLGDMTRTGKLGLAGMQERAELLGGTLTIRSLPGQGTTMIVEVPG